MFFLFLLSALIFYKDIVKMSLTEKRIAKLYVNHVILLKSVVKVEVVSHYYYLCKKIRYIIAIMRKMFFIAVAVCSAFVVASCKSNDNLYKTAYDEALMEQNNGGQSQQSEAVEIAPVVSSTVKAADVDESYRTEKVVIASGNAALLKEYSVVCGSYKNKDGAERVRAELVGEGYDAIIVQNPNGLYRVICASYDSRNEAAQARARFKAAHPQNADYQKAWLLYNK